MTRTIHNDHTWALAHFETLLGVAESLFRNPFQLVLPWRWAHYRRIIGRMREEYGNS